MTILSLADDATGALEVGAQFASGGTAARVWFGDEPAGVPAGPPGAALVIDTETRHLSPRAAHDRVFRVAGGGADFIFKKTDSTLRGNIAAEFRALLELFPERPLVYAPAYPALGRTVAGGELFVDGLPLRETAFARDPLNPVRDGFIPALLAECGARVEIVADPARIGSLEAGVLYVCDGSKDADLAAAASALHRSGQPCVAAGPGAFAGHWIRPLAAFSLPQRPVAGRCLIVNGSLHPVSRRQTEIASDGGWPILNTPEDRRNDPLAIAQKLALSVRAALARDPFDGLVVFGGDTLYAILKALEIDIVEACGELLPGVPLSRARWRNRDLALITKAGGFGQPDVLASIRRSLERHL
jgi:D-threonate/D-erythronate kinase